MNAIITSTIKPSASASLDGTRTTFTCEERLQQTRRTVDSLIALGINNITILDNSPGVIGDGLCDLLAPAKFESFKHPLFRNRGISELWLLLSAAESISLSEPLVKISGRYFLERDSPVRDYKWEHDVLALVNQSGKHPQFSTRAYAVKSGQLCIDLWRNTLSEMYGYRTRIHGPRSAMSIVTNSLFRMSDKNDYSDPTISVEQGMFLAAQKLGVTIDPVPYIGVSGFLGAGSGEYIRE